MLIVLDYASANEVPKGAGWCALSFAAFHRRNPSGREWKVEKAEGNPLVAENLAQRPGRQDALAPFDQAVGVRGVDSLPVLRRQGAELELQLADQEPDFPLAASFLLSLLQPLPGPAHHRLSQHGSHLVKIEYRRNGRRRKPGRQKRILEKRKKRPPQVRIFRSSQEPGQLLHRP